MPLHKTRNQTLTKSTLVHVLLSDSWPNEAKGSGDSTLPVQWSWGALIKEGEGGHFTVTLALLITISSLFPSPPFPLFLRLIRISISVKCAAQCVLGYRDIQVMMFIDIL